MQCDPTTPLWRTWQSYEVLFGRKRKLEYIHNNQVKRGHFDDPLHWRYSSARSDAGRPGLVEVITDWR